MPRHREITLKFAAVYQIGVPFATVRGNHQEVLIVTMDDEWLADEQLREKAERVRKRLAMRRERPLE
ncbi:hypothetical protein KOR34_09020 [Posidoniimonas corsicana]|uniref:Uncharacterized protein n=1 Tax=Posidoniimonas corsicana TaxID=1938618 RepID=A0A5C5VEB5_9BACT|nr:hypothetical protein [Posidoniimonas corsicana]TWT36005.1 hypothetical protein KOR34_09020 [Posidoniimonas corsicana]